MVDTIKGQLIVIENMEDLTNLLGWRDANKDLVRTFDPIIRAGVIEYGEGSFYRQEFQFITDYVVRHEYLAGGIFKGFGFEYDRRTWKVDNVRGTVSFYPTDLAMQDMITVHASVMAVLQFAPQFVEEVDNKLVIKVR